MSPHPAPSSSRACRLTLLVGGIYSVIKSKAPVTTAEYGERYTLIGPLHHQSVRLLVVLFAALSANYLQATVEVEEMEPTNPELTATMQAMKDRGIGMMYGRWLIEGAPRVLLFDTKTAYGYLNEWKADLWNVASIPSPPNDDETNEAIVFGYLVAWFLGEVCFAAGTATAQELALTPTAFSSCATRRTRLSLPTSTSGWPASPYL